LIFQDPQTSLNPILTVGEQLIETIETHLKECVKESLHTSKDNQAKIDEIIRSKKFKSLKN